MSPDRTLPQLKVFLEARQWGRGGEVVVRSGAETGRVFFVAGKIAWATASTNQRSFLACIVEHSDLSKEQLQEVFEDCKQSGRNFAETIVEWGLLGEAVLRRLVLQHLAECLFEILSWNPVDSMFVPDERSYKGRLTFELEELLRAVTELDSDQRLGLGRVLAGAPLRDPGPVALESSPAPEWPGAAPAPGQLLDQLVATPELGPVEAAAGLDGATEETSFPLGAAQPLLTSRRRSGRGRLLAVSAAGGIAILVLAGVIVCQLVEAPPPAPVAAPAGPAPVRTGELQIASTPSGAQVFLDGVAAGVTPVRIDRVEAGRKHALKVTLDGWQAWETRFVLTNTTRPLDFEALLRKLPPRPAAPDKPATAAAPSAGVRQPQAGTPGQRPGPEPALPILAAEAPGVGKGTLVVSSRPARAEIYLDGVRTGKRTPASLRGVPAGRMHAVQLTLRGHAPSQKVFKLPKNRTTRIALVLRKGTSKTITNAPITVDSIPPGALVLLDGKRQKRLTPLTLTLSKPGKLELRRKGYQPWLRLVSPVQGMNLTFNVQLKKRR